jgi:signal transduction histidine kinase
MSPAIMEQKINRVEEQVAHMVVLLDDVLMVGKGDAGEIKNNPTHINFGNFIYEIMEEVYYSCQKSHEIELIDSRELKNSSILIDEKLGRNIFINLLSNAVKFSLKAKKSRLNYHQKKKRPLLWLQISELEFPNLSLQIYLRLLFGKKMLI